MDVAVEQDNLAQAIGRNGQNVRLANTTGVGTECDDRRGYELQARRRKCGSTE